MKGDFTAYYLNQQEFKHTIQSNQRFAPPYFPYFFIHIENYLDPETFEGMIAFADYNTDPIYATKLNDRSNVMMQEYYAKKDGVFTFDGIRYFKIMNVSQRRNDGMLIYIFKFISTPSFSEKDTAFMIMPFGNKLLNDFYRENIKTYLTGCDLKIKVFRSDDFTGSDVVADTLLNQIKKAEFIICEITDCNKNVFFETGYAKGINKDIIFLLEQNKPPNFFDVNHIRRIEYRYEKPNEFREVLRATLVSVRSSRLE